MDKSTSFLEGCDDLAPLVLLGKPIVRAAEFKQLGVRIRIGWCCGARPVMEARIDKCSSAL